MRPLFYATRSRFCSSRPLYRATIPRFRSVRPFDRAMLPRFRAARLRIDSGFSQCCYLIRCLDRMVYSLRSWGRKDRAIFLLRLLPAARNPRIIGARDAVRKRAKRREKREKKKRAEK